MHFLLPDMDPYSLQEGVPPFVELSSSREVVKGILVRANPKPFVEYHFL